MSISSQVTAERRRPSSRRSSLSVAVPALSALSLLLAMAFSAPAAHAAGGQAGGGGSNEPIALGGRDHPDQAGANGDSVGGGVLAGGGGGAGTVGGNGGNGGSQGGQGGSAPGESGADGSVGASGHGGGGGGGGAHGYTGFASGITGDVQGGAGGKGGNGGLSAIPSPPSPPVPGPAGSGGGGGAGGTAALLTGQGQHHVVAGVTFKGGDGGQGGNGAHSVARQGGAGSGGSGGGGVLLRDPGMTLIVRGDVVGGNGGAGGEASAAVGGGGGAGGIAVEGDGSHVHVQSTGSLQGGAGGANSQYFQALPEGTGGHGLKLSGGNITNQNLIAGGNAGERQSGTGPATAGGIGVVGSNLSITNRGTIRGGLDGRGTVRAVAVHFQGGTNSLTLGTLSAAPVFEGGIQLDSGTLTLQAEANETLSDALGGNGTLLIASSLVTTAAHGFRGAVNVQHGSTLQLDGSFTDVSLLTVEQGGTLSGSGNVGDTLVKNGGFIAPGPGVTTLRILGDLTMEAGSTYRVKVDPQTQTGDYLKVSGKATLAGTALHVGPESAFDIATTHTILSASEIVGGFTTVKSDYAYLTASLTQVENDINMKLERRQVDPDMIAHPGKPKPGQTDGGTREIRFSDLAMSPNQASAGNALETLPASSPLYKTVLTLPAGTPADALAQLSGDSHATAGNAMVNGGSLVRTLPVNPLRNNLVAPMLPGAPTAAAGASDAAPSGSVLPRSAAQPAWAQVYGSWQRLGGHNGSADARQRTGGVFVGADHEVGQGWRVGGALGFGNTDMTVSDRSAKNDIASYSATLYGGKAFDGVGPGKIVALAGVGYTWYDVTSKRQVNLPGLSESLQADYGAGLAQVFGEVGYALAINPTLTLEPFAGVAWSDLRRRSFTEEGGISALSSESQKQDLTTTTLGLRARSALQVGARDVSLSGTLGWRHTFGGRAVQSRMAFQGSEAFTVAGAPVAQDTALVELGASVAVGRNASAGLAYNGEFGGGNREHAGMVRLRWGF